MHPRQRRYPVWRSAKARAWLDPGELAGTLSRPAPVEADRAFAVPPDVHPRQRSRLNEQLPSRGVLGGDLAIPCQERRHGFQELRVGAEVVGRIGVDEIEGAGVLLHQTGEAGGEIEAADLQE